jgi:hypothetical protein
MEVERGSYADRPWNCETFEMICNPSLLFRESKTDPKNVWPGPLNSVEDCARFERTRGPKWWTVPAGYLETWKSSAQSRDQLRCNTGLPSIEVVPPSSIDAISATLFH